MNKRFVILAVAVWLGASAMGWADTIKKTEGSAMGDVTEMSALEVTIEKDAVPTPVPVNEIEWIRYSDEPSFLNTARTAVAAGRYEDAVAALEKIKLGDVERQEVKQDVLFYTALAKARIALAGNDPEAIIKAGQLMAAFVKDNPGNYHYLDACEVVGDALVAVGKYSPAQNYYSQVGKAPWPDYKMRAGVALGRALLAEGKAADAMRSFQSVLDANAQSELADHQRLAATLGKARCLAEANKNDEAVTLVEGVIAKASPEQSELHARAYNALGIAHSKAGRTKEALLAFLHVDVLYFSSSKEHIEALENLVELWTKIEKPERAERAAKILRDQYKRSPRSN